MIARIAVDGVSLSSVHEVWRTLEAVSDMLYRSTMCHCHHISHGTSVEPRGRKKRNKRIRIKEVCLRVRNSRYVPVIVESLLLTRTWNLPNGSQKLQRLSQSLPTKVTKSDLCWFTSGASLERLEREVHLPDIPDVSFGEISKVMFDIWNTQTGV